MEILAKPKGWREVLSDVPVGGSVTIDPSDANAVRLAIWRMSDDFEFKTEEVDVTIKAKKSGVETCSTYLQLTRLR